MVYFGSDGGDIESSGTIVAQNADGSGGIVRVEGGEGSAVSISGSIDVSSDTSTGGSVHVTGSKVGLFADASIDASGETGGGEVLIGGD